MGPLSRSSVLPSFSKSALALVKRALRLSAVDLFLLPPTPPPPQLLLPFSLSSDDDDPFPSSEILRVEDV